MTKKANDYWQKRYPHDSKLGEFLDAADTCTITLTGVGGTKVWDNSGGDSSSHLSIALIA